MRCADDSCGAEPATVITISDFIQAGGKALSLEVIAGRDRLSHEVVEPIVSRSGLALTGFFDHFAWERLQLIGNAESAYLDSLDDATRLQRLRGLFDQKAYCLVYTDGHRPRPEEVALAETAGAVVLATPLKTREFVHRSYSVLGRLAAPCTKVYATMVEVGGLGVLFEGDPGLGKSETALGLIRRGAALIADDLTCLRRESNGLLYGSASPSTAGYMEIRGIGIMHVPSIFGINAVRAEKRLQLVITFKRYSEVGPNVDRIGMPCEVRTILGVDVPNVMLPVSAGRDLVTLVETAVQQQKFIMAGGNPASELAERLRLRAEARATGCRKGG